MNTEEEEEGEEGEAAAVWGLHKYYTHTPPTVLEKVVRNKRCLMLNILNATEYGNKASFKKVKMCKEKYKTPKEHKKKGDQQMAKDTGH